MDLGVRRQPQCPQRLGSVRVDGGREFNSVVLDDWSHWNKLTLDFIRLGRPTDNAFIEALNSRFRQGCLDERWLPSMIDAQEKVDVWKRDYDSRRPDSSLG
ncbi:MAG: transposase, partial [Anaerolineae bacterium]|nr:transposase [Anaerolineae bacterium]